MSLLEWLEMQWARFNIWLDNRKQYPGEKISVEHVQGGRFRVLRMRKRGWWNRQQWEAWEGEQEAEVERRERLEAFKTPEQRAAEEARRARMRARSRAGRGQGGK